VRKGERRRAKSARGKEKRNSSVKVHVSFCTQIASPTHVSVCHSMRLAYSSERATVHTSVCARLRTRVRVAFLPQTWQWWIESSTNAHLLPAPPAMSVGMIQGAHSTRTPRRTAELRRVTYATCALAARHSLDTSHARLRQSSHSDSSCACDCASLSACCRALSSRVGRASSCAPSSCIIRSVSKYAEFTCALRASNVPLSTPASALQRITSLMVARMTMPRWEPHAWPASWRPGDGLLAGDVL